MSPVCDPVSLWGAHVIERSLSKATDTVICVSEEEKEHARSLGISPQKLRVIPNGIPLNAAKEYKTLRHVVRRELELSDDDVCIGAVGRLVYQKAFDVLIEAFSLALPNLNSKVKLLIVGSGPRRQKLETLIRKLSLQSRTKLVGQLPGMRTMSAFDVFALSSCCEGHPYTFVEALSLGLPIVTTAVGGSKVSVLPGVNGFVSPVGNAQAMATNFVRLAESLALREQMSRASLRIATEFTLENMIRQTTEVYEGLLEGSTPLVRAASAGR